MSEEYERLRQEIVKINGEIDELLAYRSEINPRNWPPGRWSRFKMGMKQLLVRRQIDRHLVYLRLQRELADRSCKELENAGIPNGFKRPL